MIDSPPRKRDPLQLAAKLARMSNDVGLDAEESATMKDAAILLRQLHNSCHKAGLTVEQLEGDAIGKLVEAAKAVLIHCKCRCANLPCPLDELPNALRPFTPEAK